MNFMGPSSGIDMVPRPECPGWGSWSFPTEALMHALDVYNRHVDRHVPIASIDVECVATGTKWNDREPGQIGLATVTRMNGQPNGHYERLCWYVKPEAEVKSYLTPLTGLDAQLVKEKGVPLQEALRGVRPRLSPETVLVGQNIGQDIKWLGLEEGRDYAKTVDLADVLQFFDPIERRYRVFSLEHTAKTWLQEEYGEDHPHDAAQDAEWGVRLFDCFCHLFLSGNFQRLAELEQLTLTTQPKVPFAKKHPIYEGCEVRKPTDPRRSPNCGSPGAQNVLMPNGRPIPIKTGSALSEAMQARAHCLPSERVPPPPVPPPPPDETNGVPFAAMQAVPPAPPMPPAPPDAGLTPASDLIAPFSGDAPPP